jgi:CspA family cold shock protein
MIAGTLRFFDAKRGFGFIRPDDGAPDVFAHISVLKKAGVAEPQEGMRLLIEIGPSRDGRPRAVLVSAEEGAR